MSISILKNYNVKCKKTKNYPYIVIKNALDKKIYDKQYPIINNCTSIRETA